MGHEVRGRDCYRTDGKSSHQILQLLLTAISSPSALNTTGAQLKSYPNQPFPDSRALIPSSRPPYCVHRLDPGTNGVAKSGPKPPGLG